MFVRVPLRKRRGRCWYGSTSARGESAGGSRSNIHDFLCTRNHFRKLVRVGLTQMFVRVSRFKTFRKMPVQHPGCENAFSGAFQRGASCVFPPPDVGTCPLWGKKSPSGPTSRFKCWYGSAFSWSAPCWVQHSRCWSREALDTSQKMVPNHKKAYPYKHFLGSEKCWTQQGAVWKKRDPYKHSSSDVGPEWVLGSTSREMEISETDPYKHLFWGPTRTNISKILKKRHPYKHFKSWARICWSREMLGPRCG